MPAHSGTLSRLFKIVDSHDFALLAASTSASSARKRPLHPHGARGETPTSTQHLPCVRRHFDAARTNNRLPQTDMTLAVPRTGATGRPGTRPRLSGSPRAWR